MAVAVAVAVAVIATVNVPVAQGVAMMTLHHPSIHKQTSKRSRPSNAVVAIRAIINIILF